MSTIDDTSIDPNIPKLLDKIITAQGFRDNSQSKTISRLQKHI